MRIDKLMEGRLPCSQLEIDLYNEFYKQQKEMVDMMHRYDSMHKKVDSVIIAEDISKILHDGKI